MTYATEAERKAARKASKQRYLAANKEKTAAYSRAWRAANPDKVKANNDRWNALPRERDLEAARECSRRWYKNNSEKHKDRVRAWRAANPGKNTEYWTRWKARKTSVDPDLTAEQWVELLAEFDFACAYCGRKGFRLEQDHVAPVSRGGRHTKDNVVPACRSCNASKGAKTPAEWLGFVDPDRVYDRR